MTVGHEGRGSGQQHHSAPRAPMPTADFATVLADEPDPDGFVEHLDFLVNGAAASAASWVAPALPTSVGRLRERLAAFGVAHLVETAVIVDLRLGASEAITNAVMHAYRDRKVPGTVTASIGIAAGRIEVTVTDGGLGMSSRPDSPGAGLGMSIMGALSDQMTVRSGFHGKGAEVRLIFALR